MSTEKRNSGVSVLLVAMLLFMVGLLLARINGVSLTSLYDPTAQSRAIQARGDLAASEKSTIEIFKQASPSVVHITSLSVRRNRFNLNTSEIPRGTGSGFIWNKQGHIVTNYHVIEGAEKAKVTLSDHTTWDARLVGVEPDQDIAILKIEAPSEKSIPLPIGSSSDLLVGQSVYAIGNPFGLDQTLTTGVISGVGREIRSVTQRRITDVIQTDAAINPGNSGGPLLDSAGRLIGINTAIYSPTGSQSAGIGFAVPVDTVNRTVPELIRNGRVERPGLGIVPFLDSQTTQFIKNGVIERQGVLVKEVLPGSGAQEAGIHPTSFKDDEGILWGDLILSVGNKKTKDLESLLDILDKHSIGDTVPVVLYWQNKERTVEVVLHAR